MFKEFRVILSNRDFWCARTKQRPIDRQIELLPRNKFVEANCNPNLATELTERKRNRKHCEKWDKRENIDHFLIAMDYNWIDVIQKKVMHRLNKNTGRKIGTDCFFFSLSLKRQANNSKVFSFNGADSVWECNLKHTDQEKKVNRKKNQHQK